MIVRVWGGRGSPEGVARYREHFESVVLPELRGLEGFLGGLLLVAGGEVAVSTRWESLDAVRAFAGADHERAVVDPAVAAMLDSYDAAVTHFDVALEF